MLLGLSASSTKLELIAAAGFDYAEIPAGELLYASSAEFAEFKGKMQQSSIPIRVVNCLFPGQMKLTGTEVDMLDIHQHVEKVFSQAAALGVEIIVVGSGAARRAPEGFSFSVAWKQLIEVLTFAAAVAEQYGLLIAVEPLRSEECNLLNRVDEAIILAKEINHPALRVLSDSYHMQQEGEAFASVLAAGDLLQHVHIDMPDLQASEAGGNCPVVEFLQQLAKSNYRGRVTIENHKFKFSEERTMLEQYRAAQELIRPLLP